MQTSIRNFLKKMILFISVLAIAACNTHKSLQSSNESALNSVSNNAIDINKNNLLSKESTNAQMHELRYNNKIYFDLDKYNISYELTQLLDNHANYLVSNPLSRVTIEGHADERGTPEYNIALGERRANAVKMYLQSRGVSSDQITTVSYGKEKPAVLGHNEAAYAKNRRAVLVY